MLWEWEHEAEEIKFLCRYETGCRRCWSVMLSRYELIPDCAYCIYAEPRRDTEDETYSRSGFYCSDLRMNFSIPPERVYQILRERYHCL